MYREILFKGKAKAGYKDIPDLEVNVMERLTTRNIDGIAVYKQSYQCDRCGETFWRLPSLGNGSPTDRLAGYEEMEEQCVKENSFSLRMLLQKWKEFFEDIHELYEYWELEKQGRLVRLPCEIGHDVFEIYQFLGAGAWEIEVHKIRLEDVDKIGKTVFLTREEAESALKLL